MTQHAAALDPAIKPFERLIVALDLPSTAQARSVVHELQGLVGAFKIGLQLFAIGGPDFVSELVNAGIDVFLDLKFHDIPNTVAMASVAATRMGVWMFNVHASGGREMMVRTRDAVDEIAQSESVRRPLVTAVTVLTSSDSSTLKEAGVDKSVEDQVLALTRLSSSAGLDGIVASAHEAQQIRRAAELNNLLIVTPGIRTSAATNDDQKRVMTFSEAVTAGSDYVVVGRPVIQAADKAAAVEMLLTS